MARKAAAEATAVAEPVATETVDMGKGSLPEAFPGETGQSIDSEPDLSAYDWDDDDDNEPGDGIDPSGKDTSGDDNSADGKQADSWETDDGEGPGKPQTTTIPESVIARAKAAGLTDEEIGAFGDQKTLDATVGMIERRTSKPADQKQPPAQPVVKTEPVKKYEFKLNPDEYDPDMLAELKGMNEHYAAQMEAMQAQLASATAVSTAQQESAFAEQFDGMIDKLEGLDGILGKGRGSAMDPNSAEFANRNMVLEEMGVLAQGYHASGKPIPEAQDLFKKAVNALFADKITANERKKLSADLKKRPLVNRSTHREAVGKSVNPDVIAAQNYARRYKEMTGGATEGEDF